MNRITSLALAAILVTALVGCGPVDKPPPYANITGVVNLNGKPLPKGTITFSTDGRPPTVLDIVDGKYSGQAMTGSNKVMVSCRQKNPNAKSLPPAAEAQMKAYAKGEGPTGTGGSGGSGDIEIGVEETIPPEWNSQSKQMRVIEPGTANKLDFEIKGK